MHNLYKIISIVTLLMLSGCAGTELDKKLERFFYEEKNPGAAYQPGGSYEAKMISGDSKSACEFRVVRHFSTEKRCIALSEWADQKHQEAKKLHAEQNKRDQKRYEERKKWDDKKDEERDKEILREQLKQQARTQRLLREIRNERNS